jgi:hypothetical protein
MLLVGSTSFPPRLTVFVIAPTAVVVTTMVTTAPAPDARLPRSQITVPPDCAQEPWVEFAETNVTLTGKVFVTKAVIAAIPLFVTVVEYVRLSPIVTGFGESLAVITRSAATTV